MSTSSYYLVPTVEGGQLWFEHDGVFLTGWQLFVGVGVSLDLVHSMVYCVSPSLRDQTYLLSSVEFILLAVLEDFWWFRYLVLNSPSVKPT